MLKIKNNVKLSGLKEEMLWALDQATDIYAVYDADCVLTSGREAGHGAHSQHYKGLAVDLRTWVLDSLEDQQEVAKALRVVLGHEYQVVLEDNHIHIEYDPRHL